MGHEVSLDAGWASLGSWGAIRVTGATRFIVDLANGDAVTIDSGQEARLAWGAWWLDEGGGNLFVIESNGKNIDRLDLVDGELAHLHTMARYEDEDLRFLEVRDLHDDGILVITECELVRIGIDGVMKWNRWHGDFTLGILEIGEEKIVLASQAAGRENQVREFVFDTGIEIE